MPNHFSIMHVMAVVTVQLALTGSAVAVQPSEDLLPSTTKGYFSVPDVDEFRAKFDEIGVGKLLSDPVMDPFLKDLRRQLKDKLSDAGISLGITLEDLEGVYGGEVCIAATQRGGDYKKQALAILVDVTGKVSEAEQLLEKVTRHLTEQGGKRSTFQVGQAKVIGFVMAKRRDQSTASRRYYVIHDNQLIAANHKETFQDILQRMSDGRGDSLADLEAFRISMQRCDKALAGTEPHARWYVDPFGMMELIRAADDKVRRRGTDMLKVLSNQGFRAIQGAGGCAVLSTDEHEGLAHMYVHAPGPFKLASQLLDFPNSSELAAQSWIPRNCALYLTYKWNMRDAFEYSKTLIDEIAGDEIFEEVLKALETDPNGPRINIRKGLVAQLADRATLITDYRLPITPRSERYALAIELTNSEKVKETIDKAMETDPDAKKRIFNGNVVWEVINEAEDLQFGPAVDGPPGFGPFGAGPEEEEDEEPALPNSAVTVAHGHLIIASHVDYVRDLLTIHNHPEKSLSEAEDYRLINDELQSLSAGTDSFRFFARLDEAVRPTYDLIRQGKMPESEMMLGKLLNNLLGPEERGVLREQEIDGSEMPDYDAVRRYLGPLGAYVRSEKDGWFVSGCLLSKDVVK